MVDTYLTNERGWEHADLEPVGMSTVQAALEHALARLGASSGDHSDLEAALKCALAIARRRATERRALDIIRDLQEQISPILTTSEVVISTYMTLRHVKQ